MKLLISVSFLLIACAGWAQKKPKGFAVQDTVCIKLKQSIKMEQGEESKIMTLLNACNETLDIQVYKQNKTGHWFSSRYDAMQPGDYIRTGISLTGKYIIYKRDSDSNQEFPSLEEVKKKHGE